MDILNKVQKTIYKRIKEKPENSYVSKLVTGGQDRILKKITEEAGEVVIASKNNDKDEIVYEVADLIFHSLVAISYHNIDIDDVFKELKKRHND